MDFPTASRGWPVSGKRKSPYRNGSTGKRSTPEIMKNLKDSLLYINAVSSREMNWSLKGKLVGVLGSSDRRERKST
jgi:hypothetical protein